MLLYEVVMEGKKIDRLDLDWEIEIFVEGFWDFFRLGGFLEGGGKVLFLHKKLKISKNFRQNIPFRFFCIIFIFILLATFSHAMKKSHVL